MRNKLASPKALNRDQVTRLVKSTMLEGNFSRNVIGSYALQIGSLFLSLISSILLARLLGPSSFGDYAFALNWALVLSTLATLGMDKLAVRSVASYLTKEQWSLIKGLVRWTSITVLFFSLFVMAVEFLIRGIFVAEPTPSLTLTITIAMLLLPLLALTRVYQGVLRGLHYIVQGQLAETILRPLLLILLLLLSLFRVGRMTAPLAMGLHVVAAFLSLGLVAFLVIRIVRPKARNLPHSSSGRLWLTIAIPLLFSGMLDEINQRASILMLGALLNTESVGIYNVAKRLTEPTIFVLIAINVALAPHIAGYNAQNQHEEMQSLVTRSTRAGLFVSGLVALLIILLGPWLLMLWGSEFRLGYSVVLMLTLGQLAQAAIGPVALLLNMTGYERNVVFGLAVSTALIIGLNYALIPRFGMNGAAAATVTGILTWSILLAVQVRKLLRIDPTFVGQTLGTNSTG